MSLKLKSIESEETIWNIVTIRYVALSFDKTTLPLSKLEFWDICGWQHFTNTILILVFHHTQWSKTHTSYKSLLNFLQILFAFSMRSQKNILLVWIGTMQMGKNCSFQLFATTSLKHSCKATLLLLKIFNAVNANICFKPRIHYHFSMIFKEWHCTRHLLL